MHLEGYRFGYDESDVMSEIKQLINKTNSKTIENTRFKTSVWQKW